MGRMGGNGRMGGRQDELERLDGTSIAAAAVADSPACSNRPPDNPEQYVARVTAERAAKDAEFQRDDEPIPAAKKAQFLPLAYFPVDPDYHVVAGAQAGRPSRRR